MYKKYSCDSFQEAGSYIYYIYIFRYNIDVSVWPERQVAAAVHLPVHWGSAGDEEDGNLSEAAPQAADRGHEGAGSR